MHRKRSQNKAETRHVRTTIKTTRVIKCKGELELPRDFSRLVFSFREEAQPIFPDGFTVGIHLTGKKLKPEIMHCPSLQNGWHGMTERVRCIKSHRPGFEPTFLQIDSVDYLQRCLTSSGLSKMMLTILLSLSP